MIYSGRDIMDALESGNLVIDPSPEEGMFSTSAVDLRLGKRFSIFDEPSTGSGVFVTVGESEPENVAAQYGTAKEIASGKYLELNPGAFVLASTLERVELPLHLAA